MRKHGLEIRGRKLSDELLCFLEIKCFLRFELSFMRPILKT